MVNFWPFVLIRIVRSASCHISLLKITCISVLILCALHSLARIGAMLALDYLPLMIFRING